MWSQIRVRLQAAALGALLHSGSCPAFLDQLAEVLDPLVDLVFIIRAIGGGAVSNGAGRVVVCGRWRAGRSTL